MREGSVLWRAAEGDSTVNAGTEVIIDRNRKVTRRSIATAGRDWAWTESMAPEVDIENRPLLEFLEWFARETGRKLVIADDAARKQAATIRMHGNVRGLTAMEALSAVMASTSLRFELPEGVIRVSSTRDSTAPRPARAGLSAHLCCPAACCAQRSGTNYRARADRRSLAAGAASAAASTSSTAPSSCRPSSSRRRHARAPRHCSAPATRWRRTVSRCAPSAPGKYVVVVRAPRQRVPDSEAPLEEISVYASRYAIEGGARRAARSFRATDIERVPGSHDDALHALHSLPGLASNASGRPYIRGSLSEDVLVRYDGIALLDPFHLKNFQSLISAIDPAAVERIEVFSGGFPGAVRHALGRRHRHHRADDQSPVTNTAPTSA